MSYGLLAPSAALTEFQCRGRLARYQQLGQQNEQQPKQRVTGQVVNPRISNPVSFPWLALCCTVLRSRWCQSGVKRFRTIGRFRPYKTGVRQDSANELRRILTFHAVSILENGCGRLLEAA